MQEVYSKINNICLVILTGIAITVALIYTRIILVPFVISLFIYSVLSPGVKWFQSNLRFPRIINSQIP